jgi:multidrug resistance efflux pump
MDTFKLPPAIHGDGYIGMTQAHYDSLSRENQALRARVKKLEAQLDLVLADARRYASGRASE